MHLRGSGYSREPRKQMAFSAPHPSPRTYRTKLTLSPYALLQLSEVKEGSSLGTLKDFLSNL